MGNKKYAKRIILMSGSEEGYDWQLFLSVCRKTKRFSGHFLLTGKLRKQRKRARGNDRSFFRARLGEKYMSDKVLHHLWTKGSAKYIKVVLLDKSEHPNGGMNILKQKALWIEKEVWL